MFDYKKEYKEFYMPGKKPALVTVPPMNYVAVRGKGDPNEIDGEYKAAMSVLYAISFTLKMTHKNDTRIEGYFDYVVPPLEGFWWQDDVEGFDSTKKSEFNWISVIRIPDFFTYADFEEAKNSVEKKKNIDCSRAELLTVDEGLCVQIMHIGAYDDEPASVALMQEFMKANSLRIDITDKRLHHEIYLSDARKVEPERRKTVIRHPVAYID